MSSCDVCLSTDVGHVEFFYEDVRRARKAHSCYEQCGNPIQPGQTYYRVGGKCEGDIWRASICATCHEINQVFSCGGPMEFGNLWDAMTELFRDLRVTSPCFNELSLEARKVLTDRWWDWKERHA